MLTVSSKTASKRELHCSRSTVIFTHYLRADIVYNIAALPQVGIEEASSQSFSIHVCGAGNEHTTSS